MPLPVSFYDDVLDVLRCRFENLVKIPANMGQNRDCSRSQLRPTRRLSTLPCSVSFRIPDIARWSFVPSLSTMRTRQSTESVRISRIVLGLQFAYSSAETDYKPIGGKMQYACTYWAFQGHLLVFGHNLVIFRCSKCHWKRHL